MTSPPSVRSARVELARALADIPGGSSEAVDQLRQALVAPADRPADWEIHDQLGGLFVGSGDAAAALTEFVEAVLAAPRTAAAGPADRACALLDGASGTDAVNGLRPDVSVRLNEQLDRVGSFATARLAARIAMIQGDPAAAGSIVNALTDADRARDQVLHRASISARAQVLIEESRADEAFLLLQEISGQADDPAVAALTAGCMYAMGRLDEALEVATGATSVELLTLVTLIWLRRAGESGIGGERAEYIDNALTAATAVAREDRRQAESLLLRAQVLLEGAVDLDEGRRLLTRALQRLEPHEALSWWRLQERYRQDDVHRYFRLEIAVARESDPDVIALAESMTFLTTEYLQDGATRQYLAEAVLRRGEKGRAAELFQAAASDFDEAGDLPQAAVCLLRALTTSDGPEPVQQVLDTVERLWTSSFTDAEAAPALLGAATHLLERIDARVEVATAPRTCLLYGLVCTRRMALAGGDTDSQVWGPLPHLLLAAEAEPDASYSAAHLAGALNAAGLSLPALHYAETAFALEPDDVWLQEVVVSMRLNWFGRLDAGTIDLLTRMEWPPDNDEQATSSWRDTILGYASLLGGDLNRMRDSVGRMSHDSQWGRWVRATATLRISGLDAARSMFEQVIVESRQEGRFATVPWAMMIIDPTSLRGEIDTSRNDRVIGPAEQRTLRALAELIETSGESGASELYEIMDRMVKPFELLDLAEANLLGLAEVHSRSAGFVATLRRLAATARATADQLVDPPTLAAEIESGWAWCADPDLEAAVALLLATLPRPEPVDESRLHEVVADQPMRRACLTAASAVARLRPRSEPSEAETSRIE